MIEFTCPQGCEHSIEVVEMTMSNSHGVMVIAGTMLVDGKRCNFRRALTLTQINELTDVTNLIVNSSLTH